MDGAPNAMQMSNTKKHPVIEPNTTDTDWALFLDVWYKKMCKLTNPVEMNNELRTTCLAEVNRLIFNLIGTETLNSAMEERLLSHIQFVVVEGWSRRVSYSCDMIAGQMIVGLANREHKNKVLVKAANLTMLV